MASHFQVILLYRISARFQEEICGLKDVQGALSSTLSQPAKRHDFSTADLKPLTVAGRIVGGSGLSTSRLGSPLGIRARSSSNLKLAKDGLKAQACAYGFDHQRSGKVSSRDILDNEKVLMGRA